MCAAAMSTAASPPSTTQYLKRNLRLRIACLCALAFVERIVDGSNHQEPVPLYFPGDEAPAFVPARDDHGRRSLGRTTLRIGGIHLHLNRRTPTPRVTSCD